MYSSFPFVSKALEGGKAVSGGMLSSMSVFGFRRGENLELMDKGVHFYRVLWKGGESRDIPFLYQERASGSGRLGTAG